MSDFANPLHEECGVFGIYDKAGTEDVAVAVYSALYALQHRGQESCGMAVNEDGVITGHRDLGLVNEVFTSQVMEAMRKPEARMATGHVRYATRRQPCAGQRPAHDRPARPGHHGPVPQRQPDQRHPAAQRAGKRRRHLPRLVRHRGHLLPADPQPPQAQEHRAGGVRHHGPAGRRVQPHHHVLHQADRGAGPPRLPAPVHRHAAGRRLRLCQRELRSGRRGRHPAADVEPGEIVVADANGLRSIKDHCTHKPSQMCVFEYIYFARPDSTIEGCSVHEARMQAGRFLAQEHPVDADVVIGVPDSGLDAALGYAEASGIPYGIGFIKNKYIGRTFIQGNQKQRENSVRIKLNVIASTVRDKRVVLIDDSIVRGTTSARIIKLLRDAGAKEVHFRVSAPPFKFPCYFGTDIPDQKLLVATDRTVDQINEIIGADTLGYLSTEHVVQLAPGAGCGFCTACFTGKYAVKPEVVLSTDIHDRPLHQRPKGEKKLGE